MTEEEFENIKNCLKKHLGDDAKMLVEKMREDNIKYQAELVKIYLMRENRENKLYYYRAEVVRVIDGDTVVMNVDMGFHNYLMMQKYRLLGIDAPEIRGDEKEKGLVSKKALEDRLRSSDQLIVHTIKTDSFGRYLALIFADGENISVWMIKNDYAVPYEKRY